MINYKPFEYDSLTLYKYGHKYKLVFNFVKRSKGVELEKKEPIPINFEDENGNIFTDVTNITSLPFEVEYERSLNSVNRSKSRIYEYAICNDWDFFATFTISPKNFDRFELGSFYKKFSKFINNYNRKLDSNICYLLVPEKHKNGAWHMHGLVKGIPLDDIKQFNFSDRLPLYLLNKIKNGEFIGSWTPYAKKFGFNDFEYIKDNDRVCSYITKYISKDVINIPEFKNQPLYFCSKGLKKREYFSKIELIKDVNYSYEDDFCKIQWFDSLDDVKKFVKFNER